MVHTNQVNRQTWCSLLNLCKPVMDTRYCDEVPSVSEVGRPLKNHLFMRQNRLEKSEDVSDDIDLVQVFLRMKPSKSPNNLYELRTDKCLVMSLDTTTTSGRTQNNVPKMYTFSRIFKPETTQHEVFEQVVKDNMKRLIDGYSFTLLTYGPSGSGKTFTLMGTVKSPGLVPRALEHLFKLVDAAKTPNFKPSENGPDQLSSIQQDAELQWVEKLVHNTSSFRDKYRRMSVQLSNDLTFSNTDLANRKKHYVWVSFVEIYNEAVYDLLTPPDKRANLQLREDSAGNVYVKNVTQAFVRSGSEAYNVMVAGKHNLVVAETGIHAHSSRSHCIFTITMLTQNDGEIRSSHIRFCDLAGCERQRAANNTGARMKESRAINLSLHVLERCLHMLRKKQLAKETTLVPYRECKLTRILGSGLSGGRGEAVTMVVTVNPAPQYAHETRHVLSLALVAKDIQVSSTLDPTVTTSSLGGKDSRSQDEIQRLRTENERLRTENERLRPENERLRFELLQAKSCISQLRKSVEEEQKKSSATMMEVVDETKNMMSQYYEKKLAELQDHNEKLTRELEEMEERERKLASIQEIVETDSDSDGDSQTESEKESDAETDLDESLEPVKVFRKSLLSVPVLDRINNDIEDDST